MRKQNGFKAPSGLERVTLTISIFVVMVGAIIYGWIDEPASKTVMNAVFVINAVTIGAILFKIFARKRRAREGKADGDRQ